MAIPILIPQRPLHKHYFVIRIFQSALCMICLGFATNLLLDVTIEDQIKAILIVTSAGYLIITLVDLVGMWMKHPIQWNLWILFSLLAAMMYFLGAGSMFPMFRRDTSRLMYQSFAAVNTVAGVLFLIDVFCTVSLIATKKNIVRPATPKSQRATRDPKRSGAPDVMFYTERPKPKSLDKGVQCPSTHSVHVLMKQATDKSSRRASHRTE